MVGLAKSPTGDHASILVRQAQNICSGLTQPQSLAQLSCCKEISDATTSSLVGALIGAPLAYAATGCSEVYGMFSPLPTGIITEANASW